MILNVIRSSLSCNIRSSRVYLYVREFTTCKEPPLTHAWPPTEPGWSCSGESKEGKALILGMYTECDRPESNQVALTGTSSKYNKYTCGGLMTQAAAAGSFPNLGEARVFFNVDPSFPIVAIVGLGHECYGWNKIEQRDEFKEAIRIGVGAGCRALQELNVSKIYIESFGHTESAAEGAALALWVYQDLKAKSRRKKVPYLGLYDDCDWTGWRIGLEKASAQNLARQLMETPSNLMTPTAFSIASVEALCKTGVNVEVRVQEWAEENRMNAFLSVAKGSVEQLIFLEVSYNGCDPCKASPVVLVGKGITFDSGGLCLKNARDMKHMRGEMGGAACVVAAIRAVASLKLPVNVRGLIPLCENMPGASATRPGDIVTAMNGKTILIGNTDFEGALVLADALCYATKYKPKFIMDVGTTTKEMHSVMGNSATGVFTNNDSLWKTMKLASVHTGDRVWRLPLWKGYRDQIVPSHVHCDLTNLPDYHGGRICTTAAFLNNFICDYDWMHLDTYGVMVESGKTTYLRKGMSGRPTRTLIEFLAQAACGKQPESKS